MDDQPGVPMARKTINEKHRHLFNMNTRLDEATGERIAAYARGETVAPVSMQATHTEAPPESSAAPESAPESPPKSTGVPAAKKPPGTKGRTTADLVADLVARFNATRTRQDHFAIVDDVNLRTQIEWLKKNKAGEVFDTVNAALRDSFRRTANTAGDGPPEDKAA
jgi:hypothetical protein